MEVSSELRLFPQSSLSDQSPPSVLTLVVDLPITPLPCPP